MLKNILLIAKEEYLTRVTKKAFIIMTLLAPVLFAGFYAAIIGIAISESKGSKDLSYLVVDKDNLLDHELEGTDKITYLFTEDLEDAKNQLNEEKVYGIIRLTANKMDSKDSMEILTLDYPSISQKRDLRSSVQNRIAAVNLNRLGISQNKLDSAKRKVSLQSNVLNADEIENSSSEWRSGVGFALAMVIYMFIFIYGVQVMKGVNEEKTNRIVEIVISTVRPFELMMGKIWGIACVGLTQFITWVILSGILITAVGAIYMGNADQAMELTNASSTVQETGGGAMTGALQQIISLPFGSIILGFLFYFLGGYLIYASLFAAVAAAVDSDSDYQQFMMPITIPLIFGIIVAQMAVFNDPDSTLAVVTSIVPLTSPIVMMVRIPFGVPVWEILASMVALVGFFLLAVWGAGKIYQTGILLYGKKIGYKDMVKWLFQKKQ